MAARFYLETSEDPLKPIRWPAEEKAVSFGRGEGNLIRLADDQASRRHCSITRRGGRYVLRDLNSQNGTLVEGRAVRKHTLADGDRIRVGSSVIRFSTGPESAPAVADLLSFGDENRLSVLCVLSVGVSVLGLFLWPLALAGLVLGGLAALNAKLRPLLQGMWIGVLGAALGGVGFGYHCVAGGLAPAVRSLGTASARIECRNRIADLRDALRRYQAEHGRMPATLVELAERHLDGAASLYCPAAEAKWGEQAPEAAYAYHPGYGAASRSRRWVIRDPSVEAHGDGGMALFADQGIRWLRRHEFAEMVRETMSEDGDP